MRYAIIKNILNIIEKNAFGNFSDTPFFKLQNKEDP